MKKKKKKSNKNKINVLKINNTNKKKYIKCYYLLAFMTGLFILIKGKKCNNIKLTLMRLTPTEPPSLLLIELIIKYIYFFIIFIYS